MKFLVALCLLALVIIQQCMSVHIHYRGEKNFKEKDEDYASHMRPGGSHKHGDCDHPIHKEEYDKEDHAGHNHQFGKNVGYNPEGPAASVRQQFNYRTEHTS